MSCLSTNRSSIAVLDAERLPDHVAIIMDGNGRWAGKRMLKRFWGISRALRPFSMWWRRHRASTFLTWTLYAFSLENNLRRPKSEVNFLMRLLRAYLGNNVQRH